MHWQGLSVEAAEQRLANCHGQLRTALDASPH
jgi:N-acetylmuramic acid 6-phosphate (MurNAc-6-P) etherase